MDVVDAVDVFGKQFCAKPSLRFFAFASLKLIEIKEKLKWTEILKNTVLFSFQKINIEVELIHKISISVPENGKIF